MFPLILDWRPGYLADAAGSSLLLSPAANGLLGQHILADLRRFSRRSPVVVPGFEPDDAYRAAIERSGATMFAGRAALPDLVAGYEPSDWLLLLDARWYSPDWPSLIAGLLQRRTGTATARHLTPTAPLGANATRERVEFDSQRRVRRIQRLYEGRTLLQVGALAATLAPVASLRRVTEPLLCLRDLRAQLVAVGAPSEDTPIPGEVLDLFEPQSLIHLSERLSEAGFRHPSAQVHAEARLVGPVWIQPGAQLDAGATIVGPAVIGPRSRVGRNALVAHSVLLSDAEVPDDECASRAVVTALRGDRAANPPPLDLPVDESIGAPARRRSRTATAARPRLYPLVKLSLDILSSGLALLVLSPVLLVTAILVKATSRGPVFYRDEREGLGGRTFNCIKFRTMVVDAHQMQRGLMATNEVDGPQFKMKRDPRITRLGALLRRTNLDELPQLFNVLAGQMSLVGPRPSPFRENQICVPWRNARLSVRPGITGLWQLCRSEREYSDFHQWIHYDTLYVRNLSFWLDLRILIATALTLGGRFPVPLHWVLPHEPGAGPNIADFAPGTANLESP